MDHLFRKWRERERERDANVKLQHNLTIYKLEIIIYR